MHLPVKVAWAETAREEPATCAQGGVAAYHDGTVASAVPRGW
jgi:hypothetical protein